MSGLQELLERVRAATGPDRELDAAIASALLNARKERNYRPWLAWLSPQLRDPTDLDYWRAFPLSLTASIDAALALVKRALPGWVVADLSQNSRHAGDPWGCTLAIYYGGTPSQNKSASSGYDFQSAPLAILAAILSALIAQEPK